MEKFGIVRTDVMRDPDLSMQAKGLYALLATYANRERTCYPSIKHLAEVCSVNPRTIHRAIRELQKKGYVTRRQREFRLE